jgi:translation elongation factor EF-Tu-like GTPase
MTTHAEFEAELYVLTAKEGGRHTPFMSNYRPQFFIRTADVTGSVVLPEDVQVRANRYLGMNRLGMRREWCIGQERERNTQQYFVLSLCLSLPLSVCMHGGCTVLCFVLVYNGCAPQMVMPGDNVTIKVRLITPLALEQGVEFALREGGRTVAVGVVSQPLD